MKILPRRAPKPPGQGRPTATAKIKFRRRLHESRQPAVAQLAAPVDATDIDANSIADETQHVRFGKRWLPELLKHVGEKCPLKQ